MRPSPRLGNGKERKMSDLTAVMFPVHDHFELAAEAEPFDGYFHDPRCIGECSHGGGCQMVGFPCDMSCPGCNAYLIYQTHERGLDA